MKLTKKLLCALAALALALTLTLPALAAGKTLIIDDMAKINDSNMHTLSTYAQEISDTYGLDVAFYLSTNDYAPGQKLSAHARERFSAIQDGFVLVNDIDGKLWTVVSFGRAERIVTDEVEDQFWAVYNEEDTYSGGVMAYLQEAEAFLKQNVPANTANTPTPAAPQVLRDPASLSLMVDEANLLSAAEAAELRDKLQTLSAKWKNDIVIVTVNSTGGATPMDFADDWFDYNGYGRDAEEDITAGDGLLLLISMEERDWWISTKGYSIFAFTDAGIEFLGEQLIADGLSDGDYAKAFKGFADWCDKFFARAETGKPYDVGSLPKTTSDYVKIVFFGFCGGLIAALFVTGGMKKKLKTVRKNQAAADYVRPGSLQVAYANEQFLYKNVTRVRSVSDSDSSSGGGSSSHSSSSGSSHGGGGGKF